MRRFLSIPGGLALLLASTFVSGALAVDIDGYTAKSSRAIRVLIQLGPGKDAGKMYVVLDESKGTGGGFDVAMDFL